MKDVMDAWYISTHSGAGICKTDKQDKTKQNKQAEKNTTERTFYRGLATGALARSLCYIFVPVDQNDHEPHLRLLDVDVVANRHFISMAIYSI